MKANQTTTGAIEIHDTEPGDPDAVPIDGRWLVVRGAPAGCSRTLRRAVRLLRPAGELCALPADQKTRICLCCDSMCSRKSGRPREIPECHRNAFGVCVDATIEANKGKAPSFRVFGLLSGTSKQNIDKCIQAAQRSLVAAVLADPVLREYCTALGLAPKDEGSNGK